MSQALYRKWRPQQWDQVVGQEHVVQTLRNALAAGRIAHAYLFAGPRGTGKTTTARLLAKAVNCLAEIWQSARATAASTARRSTRALPGPDRDRCGLQHQRGGCAQPAR
jgi:DNA polymerase III gamma/tau subunit